MISIKDPGTGKWKRKWLSGHKTKREAEKARAEAVTQANKGWLTLPSRETVAELFRTYFNTTGANRVRPVTLQSYRSMIENHLLPRLGAKQACTLTKDDLNRFIGPPVWKRSPEIYTEMISKPVWDLLSRKGKHWRPIFGPLMLETLGVDSKQYESLMAVILELSHTGALIIDDIEDDSLVRRNDKCIHLRYGVDVAINVGNMLYFIPYLLVKDYPGLDKLQQLGVYEIMVSVWVRAHLGQSQDIYWTRANSPAALEKWTNSDFQKELFEMYRYKTASAVEGVAELCAVIAAVDQDTRIALVKLARIFGVAFQIIDDVNNFSTSDKWTKVCAEDLISGKPTYPVITALRRLNARKSSRLKRIVGNKSLRTKPAILVEAIGLIRSSGALDECREHAKKMIEKEWKYFSGYVKSSEAKIMLRMMCTSLLNVAYETA